MIGTEPEGGEETVSAETLAGWGLTVQKGWTVTMRADGFDSSATPLDFEPGHYTAHDYYDFLGKRLRFVVVVAAVYNERGRLRGQDEICGIEWRCGPGEPRYFGEANLDELMPDDEERKKLVESALALSNQGGVG